MPEATETVSRNASCRLPPGPDRAPSLEGPPARTRRVWELVLPSYPPKSTPCPGPNATPSKRRGFWTPTPRGSAAGLSLGASQGSPSAARTGGLSTSPRDVGVQKDQPTGPANAPWRVRPRARNRAHSSPCRRGVLATPSPARTSHAPSKVTPSGLARPRQPPSPSRRWGASRPSSVARPPPPVDSHPQLSGPRGSRTPSPTFPLPAPLTPEARGPLQSCAPRVSRSLASLAAPSPHSGPSRPAARAHVPLAARAGAGAHGTRGAAELRPRPRLTSPGPDCRRARPRSCPLWRT